MTIFVLSIVVISIFIENYHQEDTIFEEEIRVKTEPLNQLSNLSLYDYYHSLDRPNTNDYSLYVLNPYDDTFLLERYNNSSMNEIISSCRMIPYEAEKDAEYPKYPIETIIENSGDCEDKSILCTSILSLRGFNVSLVRFDRHMAVLVNNTIIEMTGTNNRYSLDDAVCIYPIVSHPVFILEWNGTIYNYNSKYFVSFYISISNYGDLGGETILCISDNVNCYNFSFWIDAFTVKDIKLNIEVLSNDIDLKLINEEKLNVQERK